MMKPSNKTENRRTSIKDLPRPAEELTAEKTKSIKGGLVGDLGLLAAKPEPSASLRRPVRKGSER